MDSQDQVSSNILSKQVKCDCGKEYETLVVFNWQLKPRCPECQVKALELWQAREKEEQAKRLSDQREEWRISHGPRGMFQRTTFDTFDPAFQPMQYRPSMVLALEAAQKAALMRSGLFLFSKDVGVGKTHLAAAIFHHLLNSWDGHTGYCPVRFVSEPELFAELRASYHNDKPGLPDERMLLNRLKGPDVLIIDDMGKVEVAEPKFMRRVYFEIFDYRWAKQAPVIATANSTPEQLELVLGEPVMDRLKALVWRFVQLEGDSCR